MKTSDNSKFESYKQEVQDRWGGTAAYKEHAAKTKNYSKDQWDQLAQSMDEILAKFALCMNQGEAPDSPPAQSLVAELKNHITRNYYLCTNQILAGLGQMYVLDERFRNNIDKHADGTASFISEAIAIYCK